MASAKEHDIRTRAYHIWDKEGRPHGRHDHHWHQAAREMESEENDHGSENKESTEKSKDPVQEKYQKKSKR